MVLCLTYGDADGAEFHQNMTDAAADRGIVTALHGGSMVRSSLVVSVAAVIAALSGTAADRWDRVYSADDPSYVTKPSGFLLSCFERMRAAGLAPEGKALVLAMGDGRNAVALAKAGFDVTGVDISAVGLARARAAATDSGVAIHTVEADLFKHDLGVEAWDLVTNIYFNPSIRILDRIKRAVRPGGLLLIEGFASAYDGSGPPPWSRYRPGQLREALSGWDLLVYEEGSFPSDWAEGREVPLVRVLARKPG
jgi:SAM-dependent methyltransferase